MAALAVASQAHASGGQSGPAGNGTGGPQLIHRAIASAAAPAMTPRGTDGVPVWYSANGIVGARPPLPSTLVTERSRTIPRWYAIK